MRSLDLINNLTKRELQLIEERISSGKRKSLAALLNELKKNRLKEAEPDRSELFKKTFGKTYTKNQDYLLRNELRLLNEVIYDYMVEIEFRERLRKNPSAFNKWLLQSFNNRGLNALFETDIDKAINQAVDDLRPEDTTDMLSVKSLWQIKNQPRSVEALQSQLEVIQKYKEEEVKALFYRIREAEAREAFVNSMLSYIQQGQSAKKTTGITAGQNLFNLSPLENKDWRARYLLLKKHAYQTSGLQKIDILKQMQKIEKAPYFKGDYGFNALVTTLTNLALEHLMLDKYKEADKYMQECIERCEAANHEVPIGNIQNYIAIQVVLKRYEKGITIFKKFEAKIIKSRSAENIMILAGFCHLFLTQPDKAMDLIPTTAKVNTNNIVVSRLMYAIVFFQRGDFQLAYNECINLKRSNAFTSMAGKADIYVSIVSWLVKYFGTFTREPATQQMELVALRKTIESHRDMISPHLKKEFSLLWLVNEVTGS